MAKGLPFLKMGFSNITLNPLKSGSYFYKSQNFLDFSIIAIFRFGSSGIIIQPRKPFL